MKSAALLGLPAVLAACTAKAPPVSTMSISIPAMTKAANSAQSLSLAHVVLNVSAGDMKDTILHVWDQCRDCAEPLAPPTAFNLDVPAGKGRLVQVLAVYMDLNSGTMSFYYGDKSADLTKASETVKIDVTDLTGGMPMVTGVIAGRYLDTADAGPTGEVEIRYQPPGERPSLILERSRILNGWFSFFAIRGIELRYIVKESGRDLFGKALHLGERQVLKPSVKVAKVFMPTHSYKDENNVLRYNNEAETHVIGYFGPGAAQDANKAVCRMYGASETLPGRYVYGSDTNELEISGLTEEDAEPANLHGLAQVLIQGGAGAAIGTCDLLTQYYTDFLPLAARNFSSGRDSIAGFQLPFGLSRFDDPQAKFVYGAAHESFAVNAGLVDDHYQLGGLLLPGAEKIISALSYYRVPAAAAEAFEQTEAVPCGEIRAGDRFGSTLVGTAVVKEDGSFAGETSFTADDLAAGHALAICFESATRGRLAAGGLMRSWQFNQGGGGSSGPYLRLEGLGEYLENGMVLKALTKGVCYPATLKAYSPPLVPGDPSPAYELQNELGVNFDNPAFEVFSSAGDCAMGPPIGTALMEPGVPAEIDIWIRPKMNGDTLDLYQGFAMTLSSGEVTYHPDGYFQIGSPRLEFSSAPPTLIVGDCAELTLQTYYADGSIYAMEGFAISPTTDYGGFYTDMTCTTPVAGSVLSGPTGEATLYYKSATDGTATLTPMTAVPEWYLVPRIIDIQP